MPQRREFEGSSPPCAGHCMMGIRRAPCTRTRSGSRSQRMGLTHLAIAFASEQAVDELTERARAAAVPVIDGPRYTWDG
jgi:hypothetical protein